MGKPLRFKSMHDLAAHVRATAPARPQYDVGLWKAHQAIAVLDVNEPGWAFLVIDVGGGRRETKFLRVAAPPRIMPVSAQQRADAVEKYEHFRRENLLHPAAARAFVARVDECVAAFRALLAEEGYVTLDRFAAWRADAEPIWSESAKLPLQRTKNPVAARLLLLDLAQGIRTGREQVEARNEAVVAERAARFAGYLDVVEAYPLAPAQRRAVVHPDPRCLVVAGAGTGKTSTIVGRLGFLLEQEGAAPGEILLLAYGRVAAAELLERVGRFGEGVTVRTFHTLGQDVIAAVEGGRSSVSPLAKDARRRHVFIQGVLEGLAEDPRTADAVMHFLAYHAYPQPRMDADRGEQLRHLQAHRPRTLRDELVDSWGELQIANWLTLNGIPYRHSHPYEHATASAARRQYHPDFYLPAHGIYIEHWGILEDGSTAPGIDRAHYHEGMRWKRALHRRHRTRLVQTYHYQKRAGTLLASLEAELRRHGVVPRPLTGAERREIVRGHRRHVSRAARLLDTFLGLYRGNDWTLPAVRASAARGRDPARFGAFLDVFEPVLAAYEGELQASGTVDFDEMIARATRYLREGVYQPPFVHVIVDEFQDLSRGRAALLQALLRASPGSRLLCVGDDWQSIYRFSGSDVGMMRAFDTRFGAGARVDLADAFRYSRPLLELSTWFITRNHQQLKKQLTAGSEGDGPAVTLHLVQDDGEESRVREVLDGLRAAAVEGAELPSVLLLHRYDHGADRGKTILRDYPGLDGRACTIHASKGLEADFVVLPGLSAGEWGFPSEMLDDPVLALVQAASMDYPHAEERQLFYVAVTRARRHVHLVGSAARPSPFAAEIQGPDYARWVTVQGSTAASRPCPVCRTGTLERRVSRYGPYRRCSLAPYCSGRAPDTPDAEDVQPQGTQGLRGG